MKRRGGGVGGQFKVSGVRYIWIPAKEPFEEFASQNRISGSLALAVIDVTRVPFCFGFSDLM